MLHSLHRGSTKTREDDACHSRGSPPLALTITFASLVLVDPLWRLWSMTFSLGVFHLQLVFSLLVLALWGMLAAMGLHKSGFELLDHHHHAHHLLAYEN